MAALHSEGCDGQARAPSRRRYWFEDLAACDQHETEHLIVTDARIVAVAGLSGDHFDVRMDNEFDKSVGFSVRVQEGETELLARRRTSDEGGSAK
jgi:acyl dehydratase